VDGNKRIHVGVYNIKKELPGTMSELCKIDPFLNTFNSDDPMDNKV
jgi:hypothetical protein